MTAGLLHNRTENSKCKQGFLCQGMEIGSQPVLSSLDQEFGGGGGIGSYRMQQRKSGNENLQPQHEVYLDNWTIFLKL